MLFFSRLTLTSFTPSSAATALSTRLEQAEARAGTTLVDEAIMQEIEEVLKKYETAPMPYDDIIIRQLVRSIRVISKEQIQIVLKNGLEILADV